MVPRVPIDATYDQVTTEFARHPDKATAWEQLSERRRAAYVRRIQQRGGEPPELSLLLDDADAARTWNALPWLLQREYSVWINSARLAGVRRRRARLALEATSGECSVKGHS